MLRVGLTGGIGSGKTTVARIFESLGIPVFYADEVAKRLMTEDPKLSEAIKEKSH
jgi:dephospho-CoA kinase